MKAGMGQRQSGRQGFVFQARLAHMLAMPGREYAELIREIESDPLFIKLRYADNVFERAIRARRLKQTDLSHRFLELKEGAVAQDTGSSAEVEKLLEGKQWLIKAVRRIGEEEFKRCFIFNEGDLSWDDIARACRLAREEVRQIFALINSVDVCSEFFVPPHTMPETAVSYNKVAAVIPREAGYQIQFMSAHWARGVYDVDYEKIKRLTAGGAYSPAEKIRLNKLLEKIELVNIKKSLMVAILTRVIEKQKKFFDSGGEEGPDPFEQAELAQGIAVHPSIVSRAIAGRSIETPWGMEKPLKEFFPSVRSRAKETALLYIHEILKKEKSDLRAGIIEKPLSDKKIAELLRRFYGLAAAPRTVAQYRTQMKLPSAFHRRKP